MKTRTSSFRFAFVLCCVLAAVSASLAPAAVGSAKTSMAMFDGKTLEGWYALQDNRFEGAGDVKVAEGKITLGLGSAGTGIAWKGAFPSVDYELTFDVSRQAGGDVCNVFFPVGAMRCTLVVGGGEQGVIGLTSVDDAKAGESKQDQKMKFKNGRWYPVRLKVTETKVEVWVDGDKMIDQFLVGHNISGMDTQRFIKSLAIANYRASTALRNIKMKRLGRTPVTDTEPAPMPTLPLPPGKSLSMFDGKTLGGWKPAPADSSGADKAYAESGHIVLWGGKPASSVVWTGEFPREDYEISLDVMRAIGQGACPSIVFPVGKQWCRLVVGGWDNKLVALDRVDGKGGKENLTTGEMSITNGKWYKMKLSVSGSMIEAWVDSQKVIALPRAQHKFNVQGETPNDAFGIHAHDSVAALRNIQIRSLTEPKMTGDSLLNTSNFSKWRQLRGAWKLDIDGGLTCSDDIGLIAAPKPGKVRDMSFEVRGTGKSVFRLDVGRFTFTFDFAANQARVACVSPGIAYPVELKKVTWHEVTLVHRMDRLEVSLDGSSLGQFPVQPAGGELAIQITGTTAAMRNLISRYPKVRNEAKPIHKDLAAALKKAKAAKKLLLVDFHGSGSDRMKLNDALRNPVVKEIVEESFHYFKLDVGRFERHESCTEYYDISDLPALLVFKTNGSRLNGLSGFDQTLAEFKAFLKQAVTDSTGPDADKPPMPRWMRPRARSTKTPKPDDLISAGLNLRALITMLKKPPAKVDEALALSTALEHRGFDAWAAEVCDAALAKNEGDKALGKLTLHRAHLAMRLGDAAGALKLAEQSADTTESTLVLQGNALHALGKKDEAISAWEKALAINPLRDDVVVRLRSAGAKAERKATKTELVDAITLLKPTIAVIKGSNGQGSGFFITPDGLMVTNFHVIGQIVNPKVIVIVMDGEEEKREVFPVAEVLVTSQQYDVAVIRVVPRGRRFRPVRLAQKELPRLGSKLFVIGAPLGLDYTVTQGIVSSGMRDMRGKKFVQTDALLDHGVSGGPVFSGYGVTIGVATAVMNDIGLFVPASILRDVLKGANLPIDLATLATQATTPVAGGPKVPTTPPTGTETGTGVGTGTGTETPVKPPKPVKPSDPTAKGRLNLAKAYVKAGLKKRARDLLKEIVEKYPDSCEADEAAEIIKTLE